MKRYPGGSLEYLTLSAILRFDLAVFIAKVFQTVSPGDQYLHNWHIDAIVNVLMKVHQGRNRRVIATLPPRSLKSICVSVGFVAWSLGHNPSMRFACVSYSQELGETFARQFNAVMKSDWYRQLFPKVRIVKMTEAECVTDKGGGRFVVPVGGTFTGRGADLILVDDPLRAADAHSEKLRRALNDWYSSTLVSRLDDKVTGSIILVAQRLHEDDLAGKLLREGGWHLLDLPAIAQDDCEVPIGARATHKCRKGEPLHPEREPLEVLEDIKAQMGSISFSAQYLQRPIPVGGNLVKREWIKWYETPLNSERGQIVQSWDVASTAADSGDWSVCTTWRKLRRDYYLIDVWRGRLEFPDIRRKIVELAHRYKTNCVLVEQAGPGLHHIQELRANPVPGVPMPIGIKPEQDKVVRMEAQCVRFMSGQVYFPKDASWLGDLMHELLAFPSSRHDDQIDSISQFLKWAELGNMRMTTASICVPIIIRG